MGQANAVVSDSVTPSSPAATFNTTSVARRPTFTGYDLVLIFMVLMWGTNFVVLKMATAIVPSASFNFIRFVAGTLVLGVILVFSGQRLTLPRKDWAVCIYLAFISSVCFQTLFIFALQNTTVANSSLIKATAPIMLVLLNAWRGKDRVGRRGVIGALVAFFGVGMVIVYTHSGDFALGGTSLIGDLAMFGAALVWIWSVLASRGPIERLPALPFAFWHGVWLTIFQGLIAFPTLASMDWSRWDGQVWLMMLYAGPGAFAIGSLIWNRGIRVIGTSRTAVYINLQPIAAAVAGAILLGEPLTVILAVGTTMVLTGVALVKRG
jgi:drug/metabolite transporter (DMT)-like permease